MWAGSQQFGRGSKVFLNQPFQLFRVGRHNLYSKAGAFVTVAGFKGLV